MIGESLARTPASKCAGWDVRMGNATAAGEERRGLNASRVVLDLLGDFVEGWAELGFEHHGHHGVAIHLGANHDVAVHIVGRGDQEGEAERHGGAAARGGADGDEGVRAMLDILQAELHESGDLEGACFLSGLEILDLRGEETLEIAEVAGEII